MEDKLIISYDDCNSDVPTLTVAKCYGEGNGIKVLNTIYGDEATRTYSFLTGHYEIKKITAKWKLHEDGSGTCGRCNFTQINVWDYDSHQRYCGVCGAEMTV